MNNENKVNTYDIIFNKNALVSFKKLIDLLSEDEKVEYVEFPNCYDMDGDVKLIIRKFPKI